MTLMSFFLKYFRPFNENLSLKTIKIQISHISDFSINAHFYRFYLSVPSLFLSALIASFVIWPPFQDCVGLTTFDLIPRPHIFIGWFYLSKAPNLDLGFSVCQLKDCFNNFSWRTSLFRSSEQRKGTFAIFVKLNAKLFCFHINQFRKISKNTVHEI